MKDLSLEMLATSNQLEPLSKLLKQKILISQMMNKTEIQTKEDMTILRQLNSKQQFPQQRQQPQEDTL